MLRNKLFFTFELWPFYFFIPFYYRNMIYVTSLKNVKQKVLRLTYKVIDMLKNYFKISVQNITTNKFKILGKANCFCTSQE